MILFFACFVYAKYVQIWALVFMKYIQTIVHSFVIGFGQNFPTLSALLDDRCDVYQVVSKLSAMRTFWLFYRLF